MYQSTHLVATTDLSAGTNPPYRSSPSAVAGKTQRPPPAQCRLSWWTAAACWSPGAAPSQHAAPSAAGSESGPAAPPVGKGVQLMCSLLHSHHTPTRTYSVNGKRFGTFYKLTLYHMFSIFNSFCSCNDSVPVCVILPLCVCVCVCVCVCMNV